MIKLFEVLIISVIKKLPSGTVVDVPKIRTLLRLGYSVGTVSNRFWGRAFASLANQGILRFNRKKYTHAGIKTTIHEWIIV